LFTYREKYFFSAAIVNGVIVNVGEEASVKEGRILLQSEYAEIYYRNPRIREL